MDCKSERADRRADADRVDKHDVKLQAAVVRAHGRIQDILHVLHIAKTTFSQRLYRLRVAGPAKTITTINPLSAGRPHQFTAWVKLGVLTLESIARFEDGLMGDRAVFAAQRVAGDVDYPHVPRALLRRRTRMSVEIAYALDEMLKEGEADAETLFEDANHVFAAMFNYPDYTTHPVE